MGRQNHNLISTEKRTESYLIPEVQIRDFILNVGPIMAKPVLSLLYVALEALSEPVNGRLRDRDLCLLQELKTAHVCPSYQRFMQIVANAAQRGDTELEAAFRTVNHAIKLAPFYQPDEETSEMVREVKTRAADRLASAKMPGVLLNSADMIETSSTQTNVDKMLKREI